MATEQPKKTPGAEQSDWPTVNIGNASNPSPNDGRSSVSGGDQLLNDKAEKYLREVASIEDEPDAEDQQDMDETLGNEKS